MTTYSSNTNLGLAQVPQLEDPELYDALLDIHNAIEKLLTGSDSADTILDRDLVALGAALTELRNDFDALLLRFNNYIAREEASISIAANYTMVATDNMVLVTALTADVIVTLPPAIASFVQDYTIKVVAKDPAIVVLVVGNNSEPIDGKVTGIRLSANASLTVKANQDLLAWSII